MLTSYKFAMKLKDWRAAVSSSELGKISNFSGIQSSPDFPPKREMTGDGWVGVTINFIGEFPLI